MGLFRRRYTSRGAAPGTLGSGSSSASFVLKVLDLDVSGVRTAQVSPRRSIVRP
ncbi:MAG: hypothetical protein R3F17_10525 [Planctomycetota bacterium]